MLKALIVPIVLTAAACSPPAQEPAKSDMEGMNMGEPAAAVAGPISGTGVVTQVDAAAGTITFSHEAMPAISWPAMTMQFTAEDPAILQGIAVGDHVNFELKSATETSIVTMVQKQ
ncbi:copper-binding protein [Vitreimonas sp.]|uniref:copper-binding protein n=1 Tax=Vitreimonas sp. TaxID=3069702 RepID=UPI002ED9FBD7